MASNAARLDGLEMNNAQLHTSKVGNICWLVITTSYVYANLKISSYLSITKCTQHNLIKKKIVLAFLSLLYVFVIVFFLTKWDNF